MALNWKQIAVRSFVPSFQLSFLLMSARIVLALIVFGLYRQPTIFDTNGRSTVIVWFPEVQYAGGVHSCTFASVAVSLRSIEVPAVSSPVLVRVSLVDCRRGWSALLSTAFSTALSAFPVTKIGDSLPSGSPLAPCTPITF